MAVIDNTYKFAVPTCRKITEQNDGRRSHRLKSKKLHFSFLLSEATNTWGKWKFTRSETVLGFHSCRPPSQSTTVPAVCHGGDQHSAGWRIWTKTDYKWSFYAKDGQREGKDRQRNTTWRKETNTIPPLQKLETITGVQDWKGTSSALCNIRCQSVRGPAVGLHAHAAMHQPTAEQHRNTWSHADKQLEYSGDDTHTHTIPYTDTQLKQQPPSIA